MLRDVPDPVVEEWREGGTSVTFTVVERIPLPTVGGIGAVGADATGKLVVYDPTNCQLTLIASSRQAQSSFGRCGEGPGDLSSVVSLSFYKDTIVVVSTAPSTIALFVDAGTEVRRSSIVAAGNDVASAIVLDDSTVAIAAATISSETGSLLQLVDSRSGRVRHRALRVSAVVEANPHPRFESVEICASPDSLERVLVATQDWLLQSVILSASRLRPVLSYVSESEFDGGVAPTFPGRAVGHLRPRFRRIDLACGHRGYAVTARPTRWDVVPPVDQAALLELRSYDGTILYRGPYPDGVPNGARLVAAWADQIAFAVNEESSEIIVVRILKKP